MNVTCQSHRSYHISKSASSRIELFNFFVCYFNIHQEPTLLQDIGLGLPHKYKYYKQVLTKTHTFRCLYLHHYSTAFAFWKILSLGPISHSFSFYMWLLSYCTVSTILHPTSYAPVIVQFFGPSMISYNFVSFLHLRSILLNLLR